MYLVNDIVDKRRCHIHVVIMILRISISSLLIVASANAFAMLYFLAIFA